MVNLIAKSNLQLDRRPTSHVNIDMTRKKENKREALYAENLRTGKWKCYICGDCFRSLNAKRAHILECHKDSPKRKNPIKGETKESSEIIRRTLETKKRNDALLGRKSYWLGKHHSEATKRKLSQIKKEYFLKNPSKLPFVKNHWTNGESYAEKYFREWLEKEGIDHVCQFSIGTYFLDFLIGNIDLEIDGEQHYN